MIKLLLLELQGAIPVIHQQQLDVVTLELWKDFTIDEMVGNSTEKEWDLVCLGEGERGGCTYTMGISIHKKIS